MRSIFLNRNTRFILAVIFISGSQVLLGQTTVDLSNDKSKTKDFLEELVRIYNHDLKKTSSKSDLFVEGDGKELISFDGKKHLFSFDLGLNDSFLLFSLPKAMNKEDAYQGKSKNLERLFKDLYNDSSTPIPDKEAKDYFMKNMITVKLYNKSAFIKRYYNRQWRTYTRPGRFTIGVYGGVNFSGTLVSPFRFSDEAELKAQTRQENEELLPSGLLGFSAGYSRYGHGVEAFFQSVKYGSKYINGQQMNWNTGYYGGAAVSDTSRIRIPVNQLGIRYRYSNYFRTVSPYVAAGIHVAYVSINRHNELRLNSQYLSTGCSLGLGLNIHPIYALDIYIAPVASLSFNAIKGTELQTRFSAISLEVGVRYNTSFK